MSLSDIPHDHPMRSELETCPEWADQKTSIGTVDRDMLTLAYNMTPRKALLAVAAHFNLTEADIDMEKHKHGGHMFFLSYHSKKNTKKQCIQLGAVSPRRKWQKGTIFYGQLWVRHGLTV